MSISNCGLTKSIKKNSKCGYQLNQVKDLWFINISDILTIRYGSDDNECYEVNEIELKNNSKKTYHIQPSTDSASYSDTLTVNDNDVRYRIHTLSFSIGGEYDGEGVCTVNGLSLGEFVVIAQLANGNAVMLGNEFVGLKATTMENVGASTSNEFSGFNIEMQAEVNEVVVPLSSFAFDEVKRKEASDKEEDKPKYSMIANYSNGESETFTFDETKAIPSERFINYFQNEVSLLEITEGIERIGDASFAENPLILKVKLPKTLLKIGQEAFGNCTNINEITFEGNEAEWSSNVEKSTTWDKGIVSYQMTFLE